MYAKRGGSRGGFRGAGGAKKAFGKKRAEPDDDESTTDARTSKKAKSDADDEPLVPELDTDNDKNPFISVRIDCCASYTWAKQRKADICS